VIELKVRRGEINPQAANLTLGSIRPT